MANQPSPHVTLGEFSCDTLGLVDAAPSEAFTAITRMTRRVLGADVALISIVQEDLDRQFFSGHCGLAEPWCTHQQTPLSHSFCQHVKRRNAPLVVRDARLDPLVCKNLAIEDLGVIAYLGVPIKMPDGPCIGALCVIQNAPRDWTESDQRTLEDLARCVNDEIALRAALQRLEATHRKETRYNAARESIAASFMIPDIPIEARFARLLEASCAALQMSSAQIVKLDSGQTTRLFRHDPDGVLAALQCQAEMGSVTRLTAAECKHVFIGDLSAPDNRLPRLPHQVWCGSYWGTPLVFDGVLYGVLEFADPRTRPQPSDEAFSILSIISMFATGYLSLFGQISVLRNSEAALLAYVADMKSAAQAPTADPVS